jgi:hypothetical protein
VLTDLSLGQSNSGVAVAGDGEEGDADEYDQEEDNVSAEDSEKVFRHLYPSSDCERPISSGSRTLVVLHNESMGCVLRGKSDETVAALFPEQYNFVLVGGAEHEEEETPAKPKARGRPSKASKAPVHRDFAWAHVHVEEDIFAGSAQSLALEEVTLQSNPLAIVVVPGLDVVEAIANAYELISTDHTRVADPQLFDSKVVSLALEYIEARFPGDLLELTGLAKSPVHPERAANNTQLCVVIRFLGDGGRKAGAVGRVDAVKEKRELARQNGQPLPPFALDKDRDPISEAAAEYLSVESRWLVSLLTATASLKFQWQVINTGSDGEDVERWVANLLHETHRMALLTADGPEDGQ